MLSGAPRTELDRNLRCERREPTPELALAGGGLVRRTWASRLGRRRGEGRHDDHDDEEVVHRQVLLDDVAGEVLDSVLPAHLAGENQTEDVATAM
jgi:hypothetical protein